MGEDEAITALQELAFPYEMRRFQEVFEKGLRMAHYTTAENAALERIPFSPDHSRRS